MSHFSRIRTQMVEKEYLKRALEDLGYTVEEGAVAARGYGGRRAQVEMRISPRRGYDIGFRRSGGAYEIVADWWGVRGVNRKKLLQQLTQRYAYHAARAKLEEQGFALVSEEVEQGDRIHLVLRRMA
ncbi:MAG: DUF1257 domain-containing protein [Anaerolineae bacterium]|nr:DUF1257 domain-containing protein [Anaerolineae bacterium]